jgi:hypothetical protein
MEGFINAWFALEVTILDGRKCKYLLHMPRCAVTGTTATQSAVPRTMRCGWSAVLGSTALGVHRGWRRAAAGNSHAITIGLGYPQSLIAKIADQDGKSMSANVG